MTENQQIENIPSQLEEKEIEEKTQENDNNNQEENKETYSTYVKLLIFYILFPFYIGFMVTKLNNPENSFTMVFSQSYSLHMIIMIILSIINFYKWLEVPSTKEKNNKGYRLCVIMIIMTILIQTTTKINDQEFNVLSLTIICIFLPIYMILSFFNFVDDDRIDANGIIEGIIIYPIKFLGLFLSFMEVIFNTLFVILSISLILYSCLVLGINWTVICESFKDLFTKTIPQNFEFN